MEWAADMTVSKHLRAKNASSQLAIEGGAPVRSRPLPYGRQSISQADIDAVVSVLRSDLLTTGPQVERFEKAFARTVETREAAALSSGTAALHAAASALGLGRGDEAIVPCLTFAASANCFLYQGARPIFADVDPDTLLLDPESVESLITPRTKAILAVDFAGQPCDYPRLRRIAQGKGIALIADSCHALGARLQGRPVGGLADISTFSLHPVKHVTAGEGGAASTDSPQLAQAMRRFRNHGIGSDHRQRLGSWVYAVEELGFNYRLTDFQSALARRQLSELPRWLRRRREIASRYDHAFEQLESVLPLQRREGVEHAYHLYVIRLVPERLAADRKRIFEALRAEGIGVNVHYIPVHLHPYYRDALGTAPGQCPRGEQAYESILTLPLYPAMSESDVDDVIEAVFKVTGRFAR